MPARPVDPEQPEDANPRGRSGRPAPRRPRSDDAMTFDTRSSARRPAAPRGRDTSSDARPIPQGTRRPATPRNAPAPRSAARPDVDRTQRIPQSGAGSTRRMPAAGQRASAAGTPGPDQARSTRRPAPTNTGYRPRQPQPPIRDGRGQPPRRPVAPRPVAPPPRRGGGLRKALSIALVLVVLWGGLTAWAINAAWDSVNKVPATPDGQRAAEGKGRNILLVGSDSRAGLTAKERNELGTGSDTGGARTDSIMVLHTGSGDPTLLSIPRDSYVEIPGQGMNKINAAYSLGGPKLMASTIEHATGLHVDGFMEIGFGGFANVVDALDGVRICVKNDMQDDKAHIDLRKGCQTMDGKTALGYVRARYSDPEGDLGRVKRQRQFLGALMGKAATPANVLLPWRARSLGKAAGKALTVGEDDSMIGTARGMWALRAVAKDEGNSVTVPISNNNLATPSGSAVEWDPEESKALFQQLINDEELTVSTDAQK
ncbi:LCP family protein [Janibacter sp. G1551]|uniref:LCP family protein n=1 Tax=Janibacter sp. G1551 TaxID=3420440 RepID=UPI003CFFD31A